MSFGWALSIPKSTGVPGQHGRSQRAMPAQDKQQQDHDPRSVTDDQLREEYSREQVEEWRREADKHHDNWFDVMNNQYGKD